MKDGVTIKSSAEYNLRQLKDLIADRYTISSDEIVKVFKLSNLPLFAYICDISGKMIYINMDSVLYIEEVEQ
jgi:hypothetical protein